MIHAAAPDVTRLSNGRYVLSAHVDEYGPAHYLCRCEHATEAEAWECQVAHAGASRLGIDAERIATARSHAR